MDTPTGAEPDARRRRLRGPAIGLLAAGGVAGLVLGFTGVASAQDSPSPSSESSESDDSTTEPTPDSEATPEDEATPDDEGTPREGAPRGDHRGGTGGGTGGEDCPDKEAADSDASSS
jgi:hypothetical protein